MTSAAAQLSLFRDTLPRRPYATDELGTLAVMAKADAILRAYVTPNARWEKRWLVFDVDRPGAIVDWQDLGIAAPNIAAMNRDNGHAHLFYGLALPVHTDPEKYGPAIRYAASVEAGYRETLGADPAYSGFLAKNPLHARWYVNTWQEELYDLAWLADWPGVTLRRWQDRRVRMEGYGLGRNCTLFDGLRAWAYRAIRGSWRDLAEWRTACIARCGELNTFAAPLGTREVRCIGKSVAAWTWTRFSAGGFAEWQRRVGKLGGQASGAVRRARAAERRQGLLDFMAQAPGLSLRSVARITGTPESTVRWRVRNEPISGLGG